MLLTILNYLLLLFAVLLGWFTTVFIVCRCKVLQSIILPCVHRSLTKSLYYHTTFSHAIFKGISKFLKIKCLLRLNLFTDITQTCVHRTLANCRAKPGIFASLYTNTHFRLTNCQAFRPNYSII